MASITQPFVRVIRAGLRRYRQRNEIREEKEKLARYNEAVGTRISWREICRARRAVGSRVDEFFYFEFYAKSDAERDAYLTLARQDVIAKRVGDILWPLTIPGSKVLFDSLFGEFLHRRWCNPSGCTAEEFVRFAASLGEMLVKPADMFQGIGIYKYRYESEEAALELYHQLRGRGALVEEILPQHPQMAKLNPHVLNTVRVATYTDADDVHILAAAMRTNARADKCTDNMHGEGDGLACLLDPQTGKVAGYTYNNRMKRFETHPLTGIPFMGFQVPLWDEALDMVREAARKAYGYNCHWIGWDVAITPDGPALIEANWRPGTELPQAGGPGIYRQLLELSKKI